jgi:hypothetical protein
MSYGNRRMAGAAGRMIVVNRRMSSEDASMEVVVCKMVVEVGQMVVAHDIMIDAG